MAERIVVDGAFQTTDGAWRVEATRRGHGRHAARWYRIVHGEDVIDWLAIAQVQRILAEADVDMGTLVEVGPAA